MIRKIFFLFTAFALSNPLLSETIKKGDYTIEFDRQTLHFFLSRGDGPKWEFKPEFVVLHSKKDPKMLMRPIDMPLQMKCYAPTWLPEKLDASKRLKATEVSNTTGGDGIDLSVLKGSVDGRTADVFASAAAEKITAQSAAVSANSIKFSFAASKDYLFFAELRFDNEKNAPLLSFAIKSLKEEFYSVGFVGAPAFSVSELESIWQPFVWQDKKFPEQPYMTAAFHCTLPATFVSKDGNTLGVFADSSELPFEPLPNLVNSKFGVVLRDNEGKARPMVFAPILGGDASLMQPNKILTFKMRLFTCKGGMTTAYETAAKELFSFIDIRENSLVSTNTTLDNMIAYSMSEFARFNKEKKGFAYDTDVKGATRNDTSLTALEVALIADDERIYSEISYPVFEFMMSREKSLFLPDENVKTQSPSRRLNGPTAGINEIASIAALSNGSNQMLMDIAVKKYKQKRPQKFFDVKENGDWQEAIEMYEATGDKTYLDRAVRGAKAYIANNIDEKETEFRRRAFFWNRYAPPFVNLYRLYEHTNDKAFLDAAHYGARRYVMYTWMCPEVPKGEILVNKGGLAPVYPYASRFAPDPIKVPEEKVPAWRLSEIGLTPEASGTMIGHRAIFMANLHPWILRIAHDTNDSYLRAVARWGVVGRYANFPGYHINTARTSVYEKKDFPLRPHNKQSANSFHYNHTFPMLAMLIDFLVSDTETRSDYAIKFPSKFIEASAYMQSKFYPAQKGKFYNYDDAILWMPTNLLKSTSSNVNYLTARGDGRLYIALTNQSNSDIKTRIYMNPSILPISANTKYNAKIWLNNKAAGDLTVSANSFEIPVPARGISALAIEGINIKPKFQENIFDSNAADSWKTANIKLDDINGTALFFNFGKEYKRAFVYLQDPYPKYTKAVLHYKKDGKEKSIEAVEYPFEFTVNIDENQDSFEFSIETIEPDNSRKKSKTYKLSKE